VEMAAPVSDATGGSSEPSPAPLERVEKHPRQTPPAPAVPDQAPSKPSAAPDTPTPTESTPAASTASVVELSASLPATETAGAPGATEGTEDTIPSTGQQEGGSGTGGGGGTGGTESSTATAQSGLIIPQPLTAIQAMYPLRARRAGWVGVVKISALVDQAGRVVSAEVVASSGHDALDQSALDAVRQAVFAPATTNGVAISCRVIIPIRFQLM